MKFLVSRASEGAVSARPPCKGAVRAFGPTAWPGEYLWFVEVADLRGLVALLEETGGALGLFSPEPGEEHPAIEIFDEQDEEEG